LFGVPITFFFVGRDGCIVDAGRAARCGRNVFRAFQVAALQAIRLNGCTQQVGLA
jgi:hypothetical protein